MFPADYDMKIYKRILQKDYQRMLAAEIAEKDAEIVRLQKIIEEAKNLK